MSDEPNELETVEDVETVTDGGDNAADETIVLPLKVKTPDVATKGFLRRQKLAMRLHREQIQLNKAIKHFDETDEDKLVEMYDKLESLLDRMIAFALDYVVEPADRQTARDALEDLSENEWGVLMREIGGSKAKPPL